jgi:hypothetical protein
VRQSGSWGFFLGHDARGRGVVDVVISGGQIVGNRGGVWMASENEKQSRGTRVEGALFSANESAGRRDIFSSGSVIAAVGISGQEAAGKVPLNLATVR